MVKADLTRDYYGDLELQPGASENDIKKQFKKLALKYHPDRNPGREAEVNSKFQTIQSAHEVLIDPEQRAKYDSGRVRGTRAHGGSGTPSTTSSGTRGNPWSSAGSQWPPPPKAPPPKQNFSAPNVDPRKPPPPSAGAQRYSNFTTPNGTVPKINPDAEARKRNYQAWESMRSQPARAWQPPKPVPKEFTPQSGREESNSFKHAPPPKSSRPGYEEFRAGTSTHSPTSPSRTQGTTGPQKRSGFRPGTPGGDEPAASSTAAYFTHRAARQSIRRQSEAPEPPPRAVPPDPLRQFREKARTPLEPRLSTPYATTGGEKTDPFESIPLSRSRSTREPSDLTNNTRPGNVRPDGSTDRHRSASPPRTRHHRHLSPEPGIARADSDINLGTSPKRTFSHVKRSPRPTEPSRPRSRYAPTIDLCSSSDDENSDKNGQSFGTRSSAFTKRRVPQTMGRPQAAKVPSERPEGNIGLDGENPRKPSLAAFRQWWLFEEAKRNVLNDLQPDGPSGHGNPNRGPNNATKDEPSMYAAPKKLNTSNRSSTMKAPTLPTVSEGLQSQATEKSFLPGPSLCRASSDAHSLPSKSWANVTKPWPNLSSHAPTEPLNESPQESPPDSPSGASTRTLPGALTAFEAAQFRILDELVTRSGYSRKLAKPVSGGTAEPCSKRFVAQHAHGTLPHFNRFSSGSHGVNKILRSLRSNDNQYLADLSECLDPVSSCERGSPLKKHRAGDHSYPISPSTQAEFQTFVDSDNFDKADETLASSFSFNVDGEPFESARPPNKTFTSNSAENISTTFTPEDWHGKFEAGDYFTNDKSGGPPRARSGSRSRPRSPAKGRPMTRSQVNARPPIPDIDPEISQRTKDSETPISSSGGAKFNAEEWARTFKPQTFAPPPFSSPATSARPPYPPRTTRRSKTGSSATKAPNVSKTAGTAAMVDEDDSSDEAPLYMGKQATQAASAPEDSQEMPPPLQGTASPNAMDIDPPLEQQPDPIRTHGENGFEAFKQAANDARNVPVEPSRPEWRDGDTKGADLPVPPVVLPADIPLRSSYANKSRRPTTKPEDEEDFKTNFEDLKNVEPLHHPATGLHSFGDLTSNLPFPSRAASSLTIPCNFGTGQLDLPPYPRAPMAPPIASSASRPTPSSWDSYLLAFKAYMAEWDVFNTKMIMHFVARKNQVDGMKDGWLEAFGDFGLGKYREGLKEDIKVRKWWDMACTKHQAAMDEFQWFKECMREGVKVAGLRSMNASH